MKNKHSHGFSLVEILLVIGIIIALAIAAFILYPRVQASQQAEQEGQNITAILAQTKQVFSNGVYDGLWNDIANQAHVFPASMNGGVFAVATPIKSVWGAPAGISAGVVATIPAAAPAATGARKFSIIYAGVPAEPCSRLATGVGNNMDQVFINGETTAGTAAGLVTAAAQVKASNQSVNQANAVTFCNNGAAGTATIVFVAN